MKMIISPLTSTPETEPAIRAILRGEYELIVKDAREGNKRVRKYLVGTDLSGEVQHALHALEWTIGTLFTEGDTLMSIYTIDQDTVKDGSKIVSDVRIVKELSSQGAAMVTTLVAIKTFIHGTGSPLSNIGDISERTR